MRDLGLEQTRLARQQRSTEQQRILAEIYILNGEMKEGLANAADHALLRNLEKELHQEAQALTADCSTMDPSCCFFTPPPPVLRMTAQEVLLHWAPDWRAR